MDKKQKNLSIDIDMKIYGALLDGNVELLKQLFSGNKNILEITQPSRWNWLHQSLIDFFHDKPPKQSIEYLIDKGVPVNAQDCYGMTPLHYAVRSGNYDAVKVLLEAGADPNIENQDGSIPLDFGFELPVNLNLIELLLQYGSDIHHEVNGWTIIDFIKEYDPNPDEVLMQLLEKYA